jgi:hypothetical protein
VVTLSKLDTFDLDRPSPQVNDRAASSASLDLAKRRYHMMAKVYIALHKAMVAHSRAHNPAS